MYCIWIAKIDIATHKPWTAKFASILTPRTWYEGSYKVIKGLNSSQNSTYHVVGEKQEKFSVFSLGRPKKTLKQPF